MEEKTKHCPYCGEEIKVSAIKCRYCNEWMLKDQIGEKHFIKNPSQTDFHIDNNVTTKENQQGWFEHFFIDTFFKHYADFGGNLCRKKYWLALAWLWLILATVYATELLIVDEYESMQTENWTYLFPFLILLGTVIPLFAMSARRLNDIGKNRTFLLIFAIPLVIPLVNCIYNYTVATSELCDMDHQLTMIYTRLIFSLIALLAGIVSLVFCCIKGSTTYKKIKAKTVDIMILVVCCLLIVAGTVKSMRNLMDNYQYDHNIVAKSDSSQVENDSINQKVIVDSQNKEDIADDNVNQSDISDDSYSENHGDDENKKEYNKKLVGDMQGFPITMILNYNGIDQKHFITYYSGVYKNVRYGTSMKIKGVWQKGYLVLDGHADDTMYHFELDDSDCDGIYNGICTTTSGKELNVRLSEQSN